MNSPASSRSLPAQPDDWLARLAGTLRVTADLNRLHLLDRLGDDELTVTQVAERIGRPYQHASSHLRALHAERLLVRRRAGPHMLYRRASNGRGELVAFLLAWARRTHRAV